MTKDEALDLALEALQFALHVGFDESSESQIKKGAKAWQQHQQAITAIKQARSAQQEPVAWMSASRFEELQKGFTVMTTLTKQRAFEDDVAIHTTPPAAQRQWVGLTDEDVYPLANEHLHHQTEGYEVSGIYDLARAIEAKLKEKNK